MTKTIDKKYNIKDFFYSRDKFIKLFASGLNFYFGIDPSSSLHAGHLPLVLFAINYLKEFKKSKCYILLGDFTVSVGDPSMKNKSRSSFPTKTEIGDNIQSIKNTITKIIANNHPEIIERIHFVKNSDWLSKMDLTTYLEHCSQISVNKLVKYETFSKRLSEKEHLGMSEFLYPTLQCFDFMHLYKHECVRMQIGGSDQWHNMTTNIKEGMVACSLNLINYGKTKISKSGKHACWLDQKKTAPLTLFDTMLSLKDEEKDKFCNMMCLKGEGDPNNYKLCFIKIIELVHGENVKNTISRIISNKPITLNEAKSTIEELSFSKIEKMIKSGAKLKVIQTFKDFENGLDYEIIKIGKKTAIKKTDKN